MFFDEKSLKTPAPSASSTPLRSPSFSVLEKPEKSKNTTEYFSEKKGEKGYGYDLADYSADHTSARRKRKNTLLYLFITFFTIILIISVLIYLYLSGRRSPVTNSSNKVAAFEETPFVPPTDLISGPSVTSQSSNSNSANYYTDLDLGANPFPSPASRTPSANNDYCRSVNPEHTNDQTG